MDSMMEKHRLPSNKEVQNSQFCIHNYGYGLLGCKRHLPDETSPCPAILFLSYQLKKKNLGHSKESQVPGPPVLHLKQTHFLQ